MAATIKTIAAKAGVSYATVSMALNDDPKIAEKTKARIRKLAAEMNYVPNNMGRALQSSKSMLAGYLVPNVLHSFLGEIAQGLGSCATANGYGLLVAVTGGEGRKELQQSRLFLEKRVDGIIVSGGGRELRKELSRMASGGFPVVVCSGASFHKNVSNVVTDDLEGGRIAGRHLLELGHRRVAYFKTGLSEGCVRLKGLRMALSEIGVEPLLCGGPDDLANVLRAKPGPTAVVAYSDLMAIEAKHVLEDAGLRVGDDVSLLGYDDMWVDSLREFDLTSIAPPKEDVGSLSMSLLLEMIGGEGAREVLVPPSLFRRGSTRALKEKRASKGLK